MCEHSRHRYRVMEAYDFECQLCLIRRPKKFLTIHHVLPIELGGLRVPDNEKPMCALIANCHLLVHHYEILLNLRDEVILILPEKVPISLGLSLPRREDKILTLAA